PSGGGAAGEARGRGVPSRDRGRRPVARASPWAVGDQMSGHSKWAQIKRKKSVTDEQRGRMYSKLLRAIEVAAREGGGSVDGTMTLASAVQKARDYSVPVDNMERAIKRR